MTLLLLATKKYRITKLPNKNSTQMHIYIYGIYRVFNESKILSTITVDEAKSSSTTNWLPFNFNSSANDCHDNEPFLAESVTLAKANLRSHTTFDVGQLLYHKAQSAMRGHFFFTDDQNLYSFVSLNQSSFSFVLFNQ